MKTSKDDSGSASQGFDRDEAEKVVHARSVTDTRVGDLRRSFNETGSLDLDNSPGSKTNEPESPAPVDPDTERVSGSAAGVDSGVGVDSGEQLRFTREDLEFETISHGIVRVRLRVHNDGFQTSLPAQARIDSSYFGAHVDRTTLSRVFVPPIPPGESVVIEAFGEFTPHGTPTLFNPALVSGARNRALPRLMNNTWAGKVFGVSETYNDFTTKHRPVFRPRRSKVEQDPVAVLQGRINWVGSIGAQLNGLCLERQLASGLRVASGVENSASFYIGPRSVRAQASLDGSGAAGVLSMYSFHARVLNTKREQVDTWSWRVEPTSEIGVARLVFNVPSAAPDSVFELLVTDPTTEATAVLEFHLEPLP